MLLKREKHIGRPGAGDITYLVDAIKTSSKCIVGIYPLKHPAIHYNFNSLRWFKL